MVTELVFLEFIVIICVCAVVYRFIVRGHNRHIVPPCPLHQFLELRYILNPVHPARPNNQPLQANIAVTPLAQDIQQLALTTEEDVEVR